MVRGEANPTPSVLVWARESAGLQLDAAAKKIGTTPERLSLWEKGEQRPTFAQLRTLAAVYRRPLATFYLQEPPRRFESMHDFRRNIQGNKREQSPELTLEIRKARDRREWALELLREIDRKPKEIDVSVSLREDEEEIATRIRNFLHVSLPEQASWRTAYEAFKQWRLLIENAGILTFQATRVSIDEARGFSIGERPLPVAVANIKDSPRGRIFTLLHEVTHILLKSGALCDLHESEENESSRIEAFCNHVAGAVLFPKEELLKTDTVQKHKKGDIAWTDNELAALSRRFGGSREAALVRLLALKLTSQKYYREKREEFLKLYAAQKELQAGFVPPHEIALTSAGPTFTALVIESFNRERITASEVSDYLQVRTKHVAEIQKDHSSLAS